MITLSRPPPSGTLLPSSLEQALHWCIVLASRFGTIRLTKPEDPNRREFLLELDGTFGPRLRWMLKWIGTGTELSISRPPSIARLTSFGRQASELDRQLEHRLRLLPHIASLKIAVIGGGTGLYTTLLGLRDRSWSLTAVISGLPRDARGRSPKDDLGSLPGDDPGMCLVGLSPTVEENVVLRSLLSHRMQRSGWRGAHFGVALLGALEEIRGSRQAALDTAAELLGVRGRVVLAMDGAGRTAAESSTGALAALSLADMIVIAPGNLELDLLPVLCAPGVMGALRESRALKVVVTKIMTAEDGEEPAVTSHHVGALAELTGITFDAALVNAGPFSAAQLRTYAAAGAHPIQPDIEATRRYARQILTERLSVSGDLARHDPEQLGERLVEIGAEALLRADEAISKGA